MYTTEKYFKLNLTSESSRLLPVERPGPPAAGLAATVRLDRRCTVTGKPPALHWTPRPRIPCHYYVTGQQG